VKEELRTVIQALDAMESADAHFHACQSAQFRHFVKSQLMSSRLTQAVEKLRKVLEKGGDTDGT